MARTRVPTYEIAGPVTRFDPRDFVRSRALLEPGTERYRAYYEMHPELEEHDKKLRPFQTPEQKKKQKETLFKDQPLALALSNLPGIDKYISSDAEGPVRENRVPLTPEQATRTVKGVARYLGADLVGITRVNPLWVYSHAREDEEGVRWGDPVDLEHPYAICMAVAHRDFDMLLAGRGISLVTQIETMHVIFSLGTVIGTRLSAYIRSLGYDAKHHGHETGLVQDIPLAIDAGLGELGRSGMLITKQFGPAVRIVVVTTELPLVVDGPVDIGVQDLCVKCKKCSEVCPVEAMSHKDEKEVVRGFKVWPVDGEACYRLRASNGGNNACFYCLTACCWTKPHNWFHGMWGDLASRSALARTFLAWLDDALYSHTPRQHRLPEWLDYDGKEPARERLSRFLHHI